MKMLLLLALTASTLLTTAYATETKTECPWMKEMNKRNNPKANLVVKKQSTVKSSGTSRQ